MLLDWCRCLARETTLRWLSSSLSKPLYIHSTVVVRVHGRVMKNTYWTSLCTGAFFMYVFQDSCEHVIWINRLDIFAGAFGSFPPRSMQSQEIHTFIFIMTVAFFFTVATGHLRRNRTFTEALELLFNANLPLQLEKTCWGKKHDSRNNKKYYVKGSMLVNCDEAVSSHESIPVIVLMLPATSLPSGAYMRCSAWWVGLCYR